ncbi:MAG: hypothetical protein ABIZ04_18615 [Opitutus sp.]
MNRGPIHLQIDELVLDGFNPADRHRIADAIERELISLLENQQVGAAPGAKIQIDQLNAGSFTIANLGTAEVGRQIAQALNGSVGHALRQEPRSTAERGTL